MIDTHCHLLPELDDGPATLEESVALAVVLAEQGVELVVCTPHYSRRYPTDHVRATLAVSRLAAELHARGVPVRLELAAEVGDAMAVTASLDELRRRAIRGRQLMVEIGPTMTRASLETVISRLTNAGLVPILAHPERSGVVQRDPALLDGARACGALVQLVAPTLLGRWGEPAEQAAWRLLETGRADLLGSDAHGVTRRRPHLGAVVRLIRERLGEDIAHQLVEHGPKLLLGQVAQER